MNPALIRLKAKMEPLYERAQAFAAVEEPSDEDKTAYTKALTDLDKYKGEFEQLAAAEVKLGGFGELLAGMDMQKPRAVATGKPADPPKAEAKSWGQTVIEVLEKKGNPDLTGFDSIEVPGFKAVMALPLVPSLGNITAPGTPTVPRRVLDMIPTTELQAAAIPFYQMTATNTMSAVPWGTLKPAVDNTGVLQSAPMTTIAGIKQVPKQALRYYPGLRGKIDNELIFFALSALENAVINAPGGATTFKGILASVTQSETDADLAIAIRKAMATASTGGAPPTGVWLNGQDAANLAIAAYTGNRYILILTDRTLWALPYAESPFMPKARPLSAR